MWQLTQYEAVGLKNLDLKDGRKEDHVMSGQIKILGCFVMMAYHISLKILKILMGNTSLSTFR